jgi:hypothetical protein
MSRQDPNGHLTIAVFEQFEKRFEERIDDVETKIDKLEKSFNNHEEDNKTECKTKRVVINEKIDCQMVKANKKFKWILYALVVLALGLVLTHPGSLETMTGLIVKAPIEQIQK